MTDARPPLVSDARPVLGHIPEFMRDPDRTWCWSTSSCCWPGPGTGPPRGTSAGRW